jgi:hypothetical protein
MGCSSNIAWFEDQRLQYSVLVWPSIEVLDRFPTRYPFLIALDRLPILGGGFPYPNLSKFSARDLSTGLLSSCR